MLASGLRAGRVTPTGTCRHPVTTFRGSNRRSEDDSSGSPREAEHGDLRRLLPQRQGGGWQSGWLWVHSARRHEGWRMNCESCVHLWKWSGCQSASECLTCSENGGSGWDYNSKQEEREQPREHGPFLSTFFLILNLLYEYQPLLKLILSHTQSQTPSAAEISSAASILY